MQKKHFIIALLLVSLLGLVTSLYLTYNHYNPSLEGSFCDITASVSCTVVNTGIYSEIVGVPVAIYGVAWFLFLGILSLGSRKNDELIPKLIWLNIGGMLFVAYFIYIEFLLTTLCPSCTLVHVLIALSLLLSIFLYKQFYKPELPS